VDLGSVQIGDGLRVGFLWSRGVDVDNRVLFVRIARPVGERRVLAAVPGPHQANDPVREVILDIRDAEHVLSQKTDRTPLRVAAAGDDERDVGPRLAENRECPGDRHLGVLVASDSLDKQVDDRRVHAQLELLYCRRYNRI